MSDDYMDLYRIYESGFNRIWCTMCRSLRGDVSSVCKSCGYLYMSVSVYISFPTEVLDI